MKRLYEKTIRMYATKKESLIVYLLEGKHLKMHTCSKCDRKFKTLSQLMEHKDRKTPCKVATYHCDGCDKGLANYQTLWKHKQKCQPRETHQEKEIPTFSGS